MGDPPPSSLKGWERSNSPTFLLRYLCSSVLFMPDVVPSVKGTIVNAIVDAKLFQDDAFVLRLVKEE